LKEKHLHTLVHVAYKNKFWGKFYLKNKNIELSWASTRTLLAP
jgi:hypothetical protein